MSLARRHVCICATAMVSTYLHPQWQLNVIVSGFYHYTEASMESYAGQSTAHCYLAWARVDYGTSPYQLISVRVDHDRPHVINWQDTNMLCLYGSSQI